MSNQIITNEMSSVLDLSVIKDVQGLPVALRPAGKPGSSREISLAASQHDVVQRVVSTKWVSLRSAAIAVPSAPPAPEAAPPAPATGAAPVVSMVATVAAEATPGLEVVTVPVGVTDGVIVAETSVAVVDAVTVTEAVLPAPPKRGR